MVKNIIAIGMIILLCTSCRSSDIIDFNIESSDSKSIDNADTTLAETTYIDTTTDTTEEKDTAVEYVYLDGYEESAFLSFEDSYVSPNSKYNLKIMGYEPVWGPAPCMKVSASLIDISNNKVTTELSLDACHAYVINWSDDSNFISIGGTYRFFSGEPLIVDVRNSKVMKLSYPTDILSVDTVKESLTMIQESYLSSYRDICTKFIGNNSIIVEEFVYFNDFANCVKYYYTYNLETNEIIEVNWEIEEQ